MSAGPPDPTGCDLVCNATPMGMEENDPLPVDAVLLTSSMFVGDVIAGHGLTAFPPGYGIRRLQDGQRRTHGRGRARRYGDFMLRKTDYIEIAGGDVLYRSSRNINTLLLRRHHDNGRLEVILDALDRRLQITLGLSPEAARLL